MRADLSTNYLGLKLKNPVVASAGPLTGDLDTLRRLEQFGVAAAVLPSLFEEQICKDEQRIHALHEFQTYASAESLSYFPKLKDYNVGPHAYLRLLETAKKSVAIPLIGSLNGSTPGGWSRYAKLIQEAGADAIELNIYFVATDPGMTSADVEWRYIDLVATVCDTVKIPVAVKIGQQFTNLTNFIPRVAQAGANGRCAVQPVFGAGHRTRIVADHAAAGIEQSPRNAGGVAMDCDFARSDRHLASCDRRNSLSGRRNQAALGRS